MPDFDLFQIDAFTNTVFGGNPAAVCPLQEWLSDEIMQAIAAENNLSETAFFIPENDGFHIRWFTPTVEVDLCGHATLATAYVLFEELGYDKDVISLNSRSGILHVTRTPDGLMMDFPVWHYEEIEIPEKLSQALGQPIQSLYKGYDWIALYDDEETVRALSPDMNALIGFEDARGILATAKGKNGVDFVSRFFAPRVGVPEDPVTGSAHCILTPFWAEQLGKTRLKARQVSARGGDLLCELKEDRVEITGQAVLYMKGTIRV